MAIKVDTGIVTSAASAISMKNMKIRDDFSEVEASMSQLSRNWNGNASDNAIRAFHTIKNNYCDNRYKVVDNLVGFMRRQVGEGYNKAENEISSAAKAFK